MARAKHQAGDFNKRLTWQKSVETPDGSGGFESVWTSQRMVWAKVEPVQALEGISASVENQTITHRVSLRASSDAVCAGDRFLLGQRVLEIVSAYDPDETGRYLLCEVEELR